MISEWLSYRFGRRRGRNATLAVEAELRRLKRRNASLEQRHTDDVKALMDAYIALRGADEKLARAIETHRVQTSRR